MKAVWAVCVVVKILRCSAWLVCLKHFPTYSASASCSRVKYHTGHRRHTNTTGDFCCCPHEVGTLQLSSSRACMSKIFRLQVHVSEPQPTLPINRSIFWRFSGIMLPKFCTLISGEHQVLQPCERCGYQMVGWNISSRTALYKRPAKGLVAAPNLTQRLVVLATEDLVVVGGDHTLQCLCVLSHHQDAGLLIMHVC